MAGRVTAETAKRIRSFIASGRAEMGGRLPSERILAEELGVSRSTIREALKELRETGEVLTREGHNGGTFVSEQNPAWCLYAKVNVPMRTSELVEHSLALPLGIPHSGKKRGLDVTTIVLEAKEMQADAALAKTMGIEAGTSVFSVIRLRKMDGKAVALEHAILLAECFPGLLLKDLSQSIYSIMLDDYQVDIECIQESIELAKATKAQAAHLRVIVDAPLFLAKSQARNREGVIVELSCDLYRPDQIKFVSSNHFSNNQA